MEKWIVLILSGMIAYWVLSLTIQRSAQISRWLRISQSTSPTDSKPESEAVLPPKEIAPLRSISIEEEALLRECFPWSVYFLESIEYRPQGVVCRGRLRTDAGAAYQTVKDNISERFADKFFVLFQSGLSDRPFFVLVPDIIKDKNSRPSFLNYMLASLSWTLAWGATNKYGAILSGVQPENLQQNIVLEPQGWLYALIVLAVLSSKDVVKYWICRWQKISTGLLYCVPLPFFPGTCGTLLQLRAPIPDRRALFDLGFGSLVVNLVIASAGLFWGLQHSNPVSVSEKSGILNFASCDPRFSLFLTGLSKLAMGQDFSTNTAIQLHPVATAAYLGFLMMAINMLPFKRFDGGSVVHAMYGVRGSMTIGQIAKIILIMLGFLQLHLTGYTSSLVFAILLMFFPTISDPTLNDVTEIDSRRDAWGMCLLVIVVLIFLPVPGILGRFLGV